MRGTRLLCAILSVALCLALPVRCGLASHPSDKSATPAPDVPILESRFVFSGDTLEADEEAVYVSRAAECSSEAAGVAAGEAFEETAGFTYGVIVGVIAGFLLAVAWYASCYDERTGTSAD